MDFFFYSRLETLSSLMKKSARQPGVRFFLEKIGKSVQSSDLIKNIHLVFFFLPAGHKPIRRARISTSCTADQGMSESDVAASMRSLVAKAEEDRKKASANTAEARCFEWVCNQVVLIKGIVQMYAAVAVFKYALNNWELHPAYAGTDVKEFIFTCVSNARSLSMFCARI